MPTDPPISQALREREARDVLLVELLRYTAHRPRCLFRSASIDDSGCGMEDMSSPRVITARPCSCGLAEATAAMVTLVEYSVGAADLLDRHARDVETLTNKLDEHDEYWQQAENDLALEGSYRYNAELERDAEKARADAAEQQTTRLREDRDTEKRLRKDAEDCAATLREALAALVDKLDLVARDPQFQSMAVMAYLHGTRYTGPTWAAEFAAAQEALSRPLTASVPTQGSQGEDRGVNHSQLAAEEDGN